MVIYEGLTWCCTRVCMLTLDFQRHLRHRHSSLSAYVVVLFIRIFIPPPVGQQPLAAEALLTIEASRSHSDITHSVGLLWTSDQPDKQTSTWPHNTHKRQTSMSTAVFEPTIPNKWAAEDPRSTIPALDREATAIGIFSFTTVCFILWTATRTWGVQDTV